MPKTIAIHHKEIASSPSLNWKQQLNQAISDPLELLEILQLEPQQQLHFNLQQQPFKIRVPLAYIRKMKAGDPQDPLLLQVMSQHQEELLSADYSTDPVGDLDASKVPGLLHKYHGRVLLITTAACAVHCRYCFRRHFPYHEQQAEKQQWAAPLQYIAQDTSISEVILSGGDPLVLSDEKLHMLIRQLENIPHLQRLRIHTRLPVVLPDRITDSLVELLSANRFNVTLVLHANHANELATDEQAVLKKMQQAGIILLNQAVLLKNINCQLDQQITLSEALNSCGVMPYYLHLLDAVQGAAHFDVKLQQASQLISGMQQYLPGYLVPKLVREIAGEKSKTPAFEL